MATQDTVGDAIVRCPECKAPFTLTDALTQRIRERIAAEYTQKLDDRLRQEHDQQELEIAAARERARSEALREHELESQARAEELDVFRAEVQLLRDNELALRRRAREVEEQADRLKLEVERRLDEARQRMEVEIRDRVRDEERLVLAAKDEQLARLREQVEELRRRAEQGSQELQGEVLEIDVEAHLRDAFPQDQFEAVGRGQRGADLLQVVVERGEEIGRIVWEIKNAKTFQEQAWLQKLRADQRAQAADLAVLVANVLPRNVSPVAQRGRVWITGVPTYLVLAAALRAGLVDAARARVAGVNQGEKQAALYEYVSGVGFRQRVEAVMEHAGRLLEAQLQERAAVEKAWAKREQGLVQLVRAIAGLHGDVDGLVGGTLPRIPRLELPSGKVA